MRMVIAFLCALMLPLNTYAMAGDAELSSQEAELEALEFSQAISDAAIEEVTVLSTAANPAQVENEFYYVIILSLLCLISLSLVLTFLIKLKHDTRPKDIVSGAGLTLIVFGTIILVLIVDTSEQLTAAIGILGAIAGYLFRSAQESGDDRSIEREA